MKSQDGPNPSFAYNIYIYIYIYISCILGPHTTHKVSQICHKAFLSFCKLVLQSRASGVTTLRWMFHCIFHSTISTNALCTVYSPCTIMYTCVHVCVCISAYMYTSQKKHTFEALSANRKSSTKQFQMWNILFCVCFVCSATAFSRSWTVCPTAMAWESSTET